MNKRNGVKKIALFCALLVLVLVMFNSGLRIRESTVFSLPQVPQSEPAATKTITRNGVDYFPRQDITVLMLLGIDQSGQMEDSGSYNNSGAADVVMLVIFDETNSQYSILYLNRDTMLEMPVLGLGGRQAGTRYGQLALAHGSGSGLKDSCENVRKTVSDFLYGLRIDYYLSMNMDAIGILNDAVGGVTVEVTDDFSAVDDTIPLGSVKLSGEQAVQFIRARSRVGDQLNQSRIQRQKEYLTGFAAALQEKAAGNNSFLVEVYDRIAPYSVTDCTAVSLSALGERFGSYTLDQIVTPEGENVLGETYMEFYVDAEALDALILKLFYAPKK